MSNLNSDTIQVFLSFEKKLVKFSLKIPWHIYMLFSWPISLFSIICDSFDYNLQKFFKALQEKMQKAAYQ